MKRFALILFLAAWLAPALVTDAGAQAVTRGENFVTLTGQFSFMTDSSSTQTTDAIYIAPLSDQPAYIFAKLDTTTNGTYDIDVKAEFAFDAGCTTYYTYTTDVLNALGESTRVDTVTTLTGVPNAYWPAATCVRFAADPQTNNRRSVMHYAIKIETGGIRLPNNLIR